MLGAAVVACSVVAVTEASAFACTPERCTATIRTFSDNQCKQQIGSFTAYENTCYKSQFDSIGMDQKITCDRADKLVRIATHNSSDGTCKPGFTTLIKRTDACLGLRPPFERIECTAPPSIVELAESVSSLSTLVAALVGGDLVATLSSKGPFTVFAPTNDGFAALPAGTLDNLMKPENKAQLVDILTFHVLPVEALSKDLDLFQPSTTVEGKPLHIAKWGDVVRVGPSLESKDLKTITKADNLASNGVVHIIDGVLIPPAATIV